jgi:hypothetical protein
VSGDEGWLEDEEIKEKGGGRRRGKVNQSHKWI